MKSQRATNAQLEAARIAQHHSKKMQDSVYDQREQMDKLAPIYEFNEEVIGAILDSMPHQNETKNIEITNFNKQEIAIKRYEEILDETQKDYNINKASLEVLLLSKDAKATAKASANSSFQDAIIHHILPVEGGSAETLSSSKTLDKVRGNRGVEARSQKSKHKKSKAEVIPGQQLSLELN